MNLKYFIPGSQKLVSSCPEKSQNCFAFTGNTDLYEFLTCEFCRRFSHHMYNPTGLNTCFNNSPGQLTVVFCIFFCTLVVHHFHYTSLIMGLKQIDHGSPEYKQMVKLRDEILRKPLGLSFNEDELAKEKDDILLGAFDDDKILGCCLLTKLDDKTLKLRQMAVQNNLQGKGIGASIMSFAENIAMDKGYKSLVMHARNTAIGFYERLGYKVKGDEFIEVNVPHHVMAKRLG
jgi:predicted GNAT family N-acyltransferase